VLPGGALDDWGTLVAINPSTLACMPTPALVILRDNYQRQRADLPRMHRSGGRSNTLSTDIRRCDDAIRTINDILRSRARVNKPLRTFA
jgi:hypothetical protein